MVPLVAPLIPVGLILCFFFLWMLQQGYSASLGAMLRLLATAFDNLSFNIRFIGNVGLKFIGDGIRAIDNAILHAIGLAMDATHTAFNACIHALAYAIRETVATIADLADGTEEALQTLRHVTIPALIHAGTHWIVGSLQGILARVSALEHSVAQIIAHPLNAITHEIQRLHPTINQVFKFVTVTTPAAITKAVAVPWGAIHGLERTEAALGKRVKALEKVAGVAAVGTIGAIVLGRLGLGWTRCSNVGRVGKSLCGFNRSLLDTLLVDSLVVFSSISLVEFASVLVTITEGLASTVTDGFRETRGIVPLKFTGYTGKLG